jgi:hypothetical protein
LASVKIDEQIRDLLARGVAVVVASRDDRFRPSIARGWGVSVSTDGAEVTLCVAAPADSRMRTNLESNGAIAATFSLPTTYRTAQLKGQMTAIREPSPQQLAIADRHARAFSEEAEAVGLPPGFGWRLKEPDLVAVSFRVSEVYDQTPGPNAGARM